MKTISDLESMSSELTAETVKTLVGTLKFVRANQKPGERKNPVQLEPFEDNAFNTLRAINSTTVFFGDDGDDLDTYPLDQLSTSDAIGILYQLNEKI